MLGLMKRGFLGRIGLVLVLVLSFSRAVEAQDPLFENVPVWRLQVQIRTCDVSDAGTDDYVYVQFHSEEGWWGGTYKSRFFLDYGRDDFARGKLQTWDIPPSSVGVGKIADITEFTIAKTGAVDSALFAKVSQYPRLGLGLDAWCLKTVELLVNGSSWPIFRRVSRNGLWLDGDNGYPRTKTYTFAELRADRRWTSVGNSGILTPPNRLTNSMLVSLIEANAGHQIASNPVYWGHTHGASVEVTSSDSDTLALKVDLDLAYSTAAFDPEVDVDFDLRFGCQGDTLVTVTPQNEDVDITGSVLTPHPLISWITFFPGILESIGFAIAEHYGNGLINISTSPTRVSRCPSIYVTTDGEVLFDR